MQTFNEKTVQEIAQRTPTAEDFFTYASCRDRNAREGITKIQAIRAQMTKEGFNPIPQDLLSMFRELDRAGIGKLQGDMFKWYVPIKDVGSVALAIEAQKPKTSPTKINVDNIIKSQEVKPDSTNRELTMVLCLSAAKEVTIHFTPNLTHADVEFIKEKLLRECQK